MMNEPWFWREESAMARFVATLLSPIGFVYEAIAKIKIKLTTPYQFPDATIICIGNASLGGVGKTPFAIMLAELLKQENLESIFLTRGYGGTLRGPVRVDPKIHGANEVGDEALLLARCGNVWVAKNKKEGVKAAINAGARLIIMDDGFQNPQIKKDVSFLLLNNETYTNHFVFPAGPWRETPQSASERADIIVHVMGPDGGEVKQFELPLVGSVDKPYVQARFREKNKGITGKVIAFCAIGNPDRFYFSLKKTGFDIADFIAYPDHHAYSNVEFEQLYQTAKNIQATLVTTEKDYTRLNDKQRELVEPFAIEVYSDSPALIVQTCLEAIKEKS